MPEQPTVPKPDRRKLKGIYRALLLKPSEEIKIETLRVALRWYDQAFEWLQQDRHKKLEINLETYKTIEQVHVLRERVSQVSEKPIKIHHLREAVELYEKALRFVICPIPQGIRPVAEVFEALAKVEAMQVRKASRYSKQYTGVVEELFAAFKPVNYRGETIGWQVIDYPDVNGQPHKPREIEKNNLTMKYSLAHAKQMFRTVRKEGWLKVINEEIQWIAFFALAAYDPKEERMRFVDPRFGEVFKRMMDNVRKYAMANPKFARKLFRAARKKKEVNSDRAGASNPVHDVGVPSGKKARTKSHSA